jgi:hypothetical protein
MTTAIAVAAVLAFGFALGSLLQQVDGATLRRWRLSRRWDVARLAREFVKAADEPLATLRGLTHMINAWERGVRRPSERYWLLYLQVFPECATGETAAEAPEFSSALGDEEPDDIRDLVATVKALEQQIAGISRRLDELSSAEHGERQSAERNHRRKTSSSLPLSDWTPLWAVLIPAF